MSRWILAAGLGLWMSVVAGAADVTIRVEVEGDRFFVGEAFTFYLVVDGAKPAKAPEFRDSDEVAIRLSGSHEAELDGTTVSTYTYQAVPLRGGEVEIPSSLVSVGGVVVTGPSEKIDVAVPRGTEALRLQMMLSKDECYLGEPLVLTFVWESELSLNGMRAVDIRLPVLADERFEVFEPLDAIDPSSSQAIGLPVSHSRVIGKLESGEQTDGEPGNPARVAFRKVIVPRTAGELTLDAATLVGSYLAPKDKKFGGFRYPSYFNNDFFDQETDGEYERYLVSSNDLKLNVKALPREGRPADFDGIVGEITLRTDVDPKVAKVDDPMNLTITLGGHPFPQTLRLPSLARQASLTYSFAISDEGPGGSVKGGNVIFKRLIRPERPNIPAVPALQMTYFDPVTGDYGEANSDPLPVRISRAETVNAFDAVFADGERLRNSIRNQDGGIYENFVGDEVLVPGTPSGAITRRASFWGAVFLGPPLLFMLVAWGTRHWRFSRRDPKGARAARAYAHFRVRVRGIDAGSGTERDVGELQAVVRRYFGDRFGMAPEAVEGNDIVRILSARGVNAEVRGKISEFWEKNDARRYSKQGPNGDNLGSLCRGMPELIAKVERGLK